MLQCRIKQQTAQIIFVILLVFSSIRNENVAAQQNDGRISLSQGTVVGLKIFPELSKTAVYSYLGIPYAQPPVGDLRFAPPVKHQGWNKTLLARDFKPLCPQLDNFVFDETHSGYPYKNQVNEDCLFLNVWLPEEALHYKTLLPVVAIITGEQQAFDWTRNRPTGLDLSTEGVIVVTIQSRTNVFGWLTLRTVDAPGNLGLLDQQLALQWIRENIEKFGGDAKQVTLLGHGTSGAANAMLHLTSPKGSALFSKLILMSGTIFSTYSFQLSPTMKSEQKKAAEDRNIFDPSMTIVQKLACDSSSVRFVLDCLRQKSVNDLLKAFEHVYQHGNYSYLLGPQIDNYLPESAQYIPDNPLRVLELHNYPDIPIIIGICSNEGAFVQEMWMDMAKEGYNTLKVYIDKTILPNILIHYGVGDRFITEIEETINWRFFDQIPKTSLHLLNAMQRLISETKFEAPLLRTIEALVHVSRPDRSEQTHLIATENNDSYTGTSAKHLPRTVYVYTFHTSNSMDLRGIINYFGGASHSSDLPFLMGPSLFQQISRRKFTANELKLCKKVRQLFGNFIKKGNPTPDRLYDAWRPYTAKQKNIQMLGELLGSSSFMTSFETNKDELETILRSAPGDTETRIVSNAVNPYQIGYENRVRNINDGSRASKSYFGGYETNEYYSSLSKVYTFWNELLPKFYQNRRSVTNTDVDLNSRLDADGNGSGPLLSGVATGSKYKHAFFSMLILVCLLLAVLCVCVYILKKSHQSIDTSFL